MSVKRRSKEFTGEVNGDKPSVGAWTRRPAHPGHRERPRSQGSQMVDEQGKPSRGRNLSQRQTTLGGQLRDFLESDPEIAQQVIRLAQRRRSGAEGPVNSLDAALTQLGESAVRALALSIARSRHRRAEHESVQRPWRTG